MIGLGEQLPLGVPDFNVPGIFENRDGAKLAAVLMTTLDFRVSPGTLHWHRPREHQFFHPSGDLRPACRSQPECPGRYEFDGKRQHRVGGILIFGKLVRRGRLERRQHVVECLPGNIIGALVTDFSGVRRGIKINQLIGQIVTVGKIPEITTHIHRLVQQRR